MAAVYSSSSSSSVCVCVCVYVGIAHILTSTGAANNVLQTHAHISAGKNLPGNIEISGSLRAGCTDNYGLAAEVADCPCTDNAHVTGYNGYYVHGQV